VAEPVVYLIGHNVVGGFYRVHSSRRADENLNSPGMHFEPLAFEECCISPEKELAADAHPNRFLCLRRDRTPCHAGRGKRNERLRLNATRSSTGSRNAG
jgi:Glutamate-cysteine ligase.